jgi:hypothetical protein
VTQDTNHCSLDYPCTEKLFKMQLRMKSFFHIFFYSEMALLALKKII